LMNPRLSSFLGVESQCHGFIKNSQNGIYETVKQSTYASQSATLVVSRFATVGNAVAVELASQLSATKGVQLSEQSASAEFLASRRRLLRNSHCVDDHQLLRGLVERN
jgi:hypothetical protein